MVDSQFLKAVNDLATKSIREMCADPVLKAYVDDTIEMPDPFHGSGDIKLVIIGQDPTAGQRAKRDTIHTVLKLDTEGPLKRFVESICMGLGITLENIYATNFAKCFFTEKPTVIMRNDKVDVITQSARHWMPILKFELSHFPNTLIISLGEPILKVLVKDGFPRKVRHYWGWQPSWKTGQTNPFSLIVSDASELNRAIYPFYHQPSEMKEFYRRRKESYLRFIISGRGRR